MGIIMRGQVNENLAEEFEFSSIRTINVLVDELRFGASAYDHTDDHEIAVMALLLRVIVRDMSGFDIRTMTDKQIERLAFRVAVKTDVQRKLGDNGIIAIEDAIKGLRDKQESMSS